MNGKEGIGDIEYTPRPDPTSLTTDQLRREIRALRELLETRLDGMDKADSALAERLTQRVAALDDMSEHRHDGLQALMVEKLRGVQTHQDDRDVTINQQFTDSYTGMTLRFEERDTRSEREARDNRVAVDAAFAAQKEAVAEQNKSNALAIAKSETAVAKQIDSLSAAVDSKFKATDDKIDDLKTALGATSTTVSTLAQAIASTNGQRHDAQTQRNWSVGTQIATILGVLSFLVSATVAIVLVIHG